MWSKVLVGKRRGIRPFGRPRLRTKDNIEFVNYSVNDEKFLRAKRPLASEG
jgi:hypothetical protein